MLARGVTLRGRGDVHVRHDEHGVPHVRAAHDADALLGLGFCHGIDRGLQVVLARLVGRGRAAAVVGGDAMFALDHATRRLGLAGDAAREVARLAPAVADAIAAYCRGLDLAFARRLPWELRLLGYRPEPWTAEDVVVLQRLGAWAGLDQTQGDMERLLVEMVQAGVPRGHLEELFPGLLDGLDEDLVRRVRLGRTMVPAAVRWHPALVRAIASNNWVVAGSRTASGRALLANDPHLEGNRLPAVWYEVALELPDRWCIGGSMPGLPGVLVGRTPDLAWGATYAFMDTIDSWIEDCRQGCFRRVEDGTEVWRPFRTRTERITRREGGEAVVELHENDHGVLDGDPSVPGLYLATRWAPAAGTGARSLAALLGMLRAPDVATGMALLGGVETGWNWVLADAAGSIGYQMSGLMPLRHGERRGLVPLPGWLPENDWQGFADPADLPRAMNPEAGFFATANQDLNRFGRRPAITLAMGSDRAERISTLLAARRDWDTASTVRLQMDTFSTHAERFMTILLPLLPGGEHARTLREWDLRYEPGARGVLLFERFYGRLYQRVFGGVCGPEVAAFLRGETGILTDFFACFDAVLLDPQSAWMRPEGRDAVFAAVAHETLGPSAPAPEDDRRFVMTHVLLGGRLPRWLGFERGPLPLRGGRATVHQGQVYRSGGRETTFMPSYRLVTDFAEEAVHTCLLGGPSDRRWSRWYASGIDDCLAGRPKRLQPGAPRSA